MAVKEARAKLPEFRVGKFGQLMEWIEDYEETEIGHRHISHAFALYPDCAINRATPELYKAINTTVDRRISRGNDFWGVCTLGMSMTWLMAIFARLRRAEDAYSMVMGYILRVTAQNLMHMYPGIGEKIFQIDANLAYTAGMSEMFIQSHEGVIALIPAIPEKWNEGSFNGLCARGGYEVDAKWKDNEVYEFSIRAKNIKECVVELPSGQKNMKFCDGKGNVYTASDNKVSLTVDKEIHHIACEN